MNLRKIIKEELEVLTLLKQFNKIINEGISENEFGVKAKISNNNVFIPKENSQIKSPVSGKIENYNSNVFCRNQTTVKFSSNNNTFYLEYCGITSPTISKGSSVFKGTVLGTTNNDVKVNLLNSRGANYYFSDLNKISSTSGKTETSTDSSGLVKYDNRYKKFDYTAKSVGDALSGVTQDSRYKKWNW